MQKVIFRLFGYVMYQASRKNKFIQTQPPEKCDALLKPYIEELWENEDVFYLNIIDYYQNRPDILDNISLVSFAADFEFALLSALCGLELRPGPQCLSRVDFSLDDLEPQFY